MSDSIDSGSNEKPSYPDTPKSHLDHDLHEHTDSSSLSEHKPSPQVNQDESRPQSLHSRASSIDTADTTEPLETSPSNAANNVTQIRTGATAATTTSVWSRPPDFEVTITDDDGLNPKEWPVWYRIWSIFVISFGTWVVVLYSTSYTAAIPGLMDEFHEPSRTIATLGVTTYLLGLAVGSLVVAPMSELFGRRPVYLICMAVSTLLVIPVALATSLEGILVVRFFGALFGAAMVVNSAGSTGDISTEDNRALYMSLWSIAPLNGPVTGPLIGGFVFQYLGWRWDMWLVLILAGVSVLMMATVKETYIPALLRQKAARMRKDHDDDRYWCTYDDAKKSTVQLVKIGMTRPFVLSFTEPICWFFNIWLSTVYGILYLCFVAYPIVFSDHRGWGSGITGLSFIGIGVGVLLAIFLEPLWSRIINSQPKDPATGRAPPEAMGIIMTIGAVLTPIGQLVFSWTSLPVSIPYAVSIAFGIPFGMGNTLCFIYGTNYLAGAYGYYAASALAGNAVFRSIFGAVLPLAGPSMYAALTPQWAGTLLGLLEVLLIPIPFIFYKYGDRIRASSTVIKEMRAQQAKLDKQRARLEQKRERERLREAAAGGDDESAVVCDAPEQPAPEIVNNDKSSGGVEVRDVEKGT